MTAHAIQWETWDLQDEADRRFRKFCLRLAVPTLLLALIVPWLELTGVQIGGGTTGKRYAELISEPAPVAEKVEEPKPEEPKPEPKAKPEARKPVEKPVEPKPVPTQEQIVEQARQKAANTGVLALADQLADLHATPGVNTSKVLTSRAATGSDPLPSGSLSSAATSGGIGETAAVQRQSSATGLGERRTTDVESAIGTGGQHARAGQGGDKLIAGRTLEEIQLAFDRAKGSFYVIYNRAMRTNPRLTTGGKVVVTLTIAPNGTVTDCKVVSSDFRDPDFEQKVVQRVMLIKFEPKDVPPFTYPNYPIYFFPT